MSSDVDALRVFVSAKSSPPREDTGMLLGLLVCVLILIGMCIAACILRRRRDRATGYSSRWGFDVRQIDSGMFAKASATE